MEILNSQISDSIYLQQELRNKTLRGTWIKTEVPLCHFIESTQIKPWAETTHLIRALNISGFLNRFLMALDKVNKGKFVSCKGKHVL